MSTGFGVEVEYLVGLGVCADCRILLRVLFRLEDDQCQCRM